MALPGLIDQDGLELCVYPGLDGLSADAEFTNFLDYSPKNRHLIAQGGAGLRPINKTAILNGNAVARFDGSADREMRHNTSFQLNTGWMVAKCDDATWTDYRGLLTAPVLFGILVTNDSGSGMFNFGSEAAYMMENRCNDRIYPEASLPGPANSWKLLYFRYWKPVTLAGLQIGRDRDFTSRLWKGDVAFCALYSRGFSEEDIRTQNELIAAEFGLTLNLSFPFIADRENEFAETKRANVYDPPEGDRVTEIIETQKVQASLKFSSRKNAELKEAREFWRDNYPDVPFLYRNYNVLPPQDIEVYFNSAIQYSGSNNLTQYGFAIKEK